MVFLSVRLSSLHILTQMPTQCPLCFFLSCSLACYAWLIRTSSTYYYLRLAAASSSFCFRREMQLSICFSLSASSEVMSEETGLNLYSLYLLSLIPLSLTTSMSPEGRESTGTALSVLLVRRVTSSGFMKATLSRSSVLTWDIKWRIISLLRLSLIILFDYLLLVGIMEGRFIGRIYLAFNQIIINNNKHLLYLTVYQFKDDQNSKLFRLGSTFAIYRSVDQRVYFYFQIIKLPIIILLAPLYKCLSYSITYNHSLPFSALQARLLPVLQSLTPTITPILSNQSQTIFLLFFEHSKKKEIKLQMQWSFQMNKQFDIFIQIRQNNVFCEADQTISVNQLIARMNRQIYDGVYYVDSRKPYLLKYKTKMSLQVASRYFASSIAHLYKQTEIHFINYALKLKILGNFTQPASDQTHKNLIVLGKLKEHFELMRLKRPKATQYYDLNNCSIKIVNEALVLINANLSLLKKYKNNDIKMNSKRRFECQNSYQQCYKRYQKYNADSSQSQGSYIASGIQIKGILTEEKIDQSKFNIIYRGLYDITTNLTINSYILTCQDSNSLQQQDGTAELVKKVSISLILEDLSFNNQIDFLKFARMKKNKRIAHYFISLTPSNQVIDNSIYSQYYPFCLATKYVQWNEGMLLRGGLQLIEGINFLSKNKILHRDLKQWNVLIDKQGNIKIIDFGSTSGVYGNKDNQFRCKQQLMSTPTYYYPYAHVHKLVSKHYSKQEYNQSQTFDVYSFGAILNNLFSLQSIFDSMLYRQLDYLSKKCREMNPEDRLRPYEVMVYLHQILFFYMSENRATE